MRVELLAAGPAGVGHALSTFLIDGVLALDAGALGWALPPESLARIRHVLLTHSHIDHIAGLPVFLDIVYGMTDSPPMVYGLEATLDCLKRDLFNDRLMPDFVALSKLLPPFLTLCPIPETGSFAVGDYTVTAFPLVHTVPTVAYLVDDGTDAIALVTDTAPVPQVIDAIGTHSRLRTVYLEASFPDAMQPLARVSKHLTASEHLHLAARLPQGVEVVPVHVKPRFAAEVWRELGVECGEAQR